MLSKLMKSAIYRINVYGCGENLKIKYRIEYDAVGDHDRFQTFLISKSDKSVAADVGASC